MRKSNSPPKKSSFALSEEDKRLFREAVGVVEPIISDRIEPTINKPRPIARRHPHETGWPEISPEGTHLLERGDIMTFAAPGTPKRLLQRLRSGGFGVDTELDLHGLTVADAKRRLDWQLRACLQEGCRCIHVIHGKGYRSETNYPILKNHLNLWLRHHPDVLAFCTAKPADGGTGAVYVLLRDTGKRGRFPYE